MSLTESSFISHNVHVSTIFAIHLCRTGVLSWKKFFHLKGKVNLISLLLTGINLETECSYGMVSFGYVMLVTCMFCCEIFSFKAMKEGKQIS